MVTYAIITNKRVEEFKGDIRRYYLASGYFSKMPTHYQVQREGSNRWYRVYSMCFGNSGTYYIVTKGKTLIVNWYDVFC